MSIKSSVAVTKLADQVINLGMNLPTLAGIGKADFERGDNKGRNKVAVGIIGLTPGVKNFNDIYKLYNDKKYQTYH